MIERFSTRTALAAVLALSCASSAEAGRTSAKAERTKTASSLTERECLARAMYFESNRTHEDGMLAVGTIVANRLESGRFGDTVCQVVGKFAQFAPGVLVRRMAEVKPAELARKVADAVLDGERHPAAGNALFFHTNNVPFRHDDKSYVLVSGGNAFYHWNRRRAPETARANVASLAKAREVSANDREVGEKVVARAFENTPEGGPSATLTSRRLPQPEFVRGEPQTEVAAVTAPDAAPTPAPEAVAEAPKPVVVAAVELRVSPAREPKVAAEIAARPDPLAKALAYRGSPAPLPVGGALAAVASIKFAPAARPLPASAKPRTVAPAEPVLASATPTPAPAAGPARTAPVEPTPVKSEPAASLANIVVAGVWSLFE